MTLFKKVQQLGSLTNSEEKVICVVEPIKIRRVKGIVEEDILAAVNCGVEFSQIVKKFAQELGLYSSELVVDRVPAAIDGREKLVDQIEVSFILGGEEKQSRWLVTDRSDEKQMIVLGKTDLRGYLVKIPE